MKTKKESENLIVQSVIEGKIESLASLKDGVFSKKMMGDGAVVKFPDNIKKGVVLAPVSGKLITVFPTGHAYGIRTKEGVDILIHIGIDTVNLQGKGFKTFVKQGKKIKAGAKLVELDINEIKKLAPSVDPIVLVTSKESIVNRSKGKVDSNSKLFEVTL